MPMLTITIPIISPVTMLCIAVREDATASVQDPVQHLDYAV